MEEYFKSGKFYAVIMMFIAAAFTVLCVLSGAYGEALGFVSFMAVCFFYHRELGMHQETQKRLDYMETRFETEERRADHLEDIATEAIELNKKQESTSQELLDKYVRAGTAFAEAVRFLTAAQIKSLSQETQDYIDELCDEISESKAAP